MCGTNCFTATEITEKDLIIEVLGERYWNDAENIYCVPIKELTDDVVKQLGINRKAQYLVAEMNT